MTHASPEEIIAEIKRRRRQKGGVPQRDKIVKAVLDAAKEMRAGA